MPACSNVPCATAPPTPSTLPPPSPPFLRTATSKDQRPPPPHYQLCAAEKSPSVDLKRHRPEKVHGWQVRPHLARVISEVSSVAIAQLAMVGASPALDCAADLRPSSCLSDHFTHRALLHCRPLSKTTQPGLAITLHRVAPLGPFGCDCAQHRRTPRPSVERILRKALLPFGSRFSSAPHWPRLGN